MSEVLKVELRSSHGSRQVKRLRETGLVPAVLYGHGETPVNLQVTKHDLTLVVRAGTRVVDLQGALNEKALVKSLQWDVFGAQILHLDLARVSATEKVEVELPLEFRGEAPGLSEGGVVEHLGYHITISGPVATLPEKIEVKVTELHLGGHITAGQIVLPPGCELVSSPDTIVCTCHVPKEVKELAAGGVAEPEVIGRKEPTDDEKKEAKK